MNRIVLSKTGNSKKKAFTLIEVLILIALVALATALLTAVLRSGSNKITQIAIDSLIKAECAQVTRPIGNGSFDLTVGQIAEFGIADLAGPSLVIKKVKVKWKYRDGRCSYVLLMTSADPDNPAIVTTTESDESVIK